MDFEQLLRKYLSGAITEQELEHFQSLLDRVPEYKAELRQTLEIRSLLHDDALTLTPPTDLSEHIRIAVSSSFAADAIVEQEEQARKRRIFLYPLRLSMSALVAVCVIAGVALSPTLRQHSENGAANSIAAAQAPAVTPAAGPRTADMSSDAAAAESGTLPAGGSRIAEIQAPHHVSGTTVAGHPAVGRPASGHPAASRSASGKSNPGRSGDDAAEKTLANGMWMLGHEVPSRAAQDHGTDHTASSIAQNQVEGAESSSSSSVDYAALLSRDPAELLRHNLSRPLYNPAFDSSTRRQIEPMRTDIKPGESIAMTSDEGRRLTIGVTLGAGQVAETNAPTVLLQNSYYLSFSLGGYDRIGVEMGASAFQQESESTNPLAKRQNSGNSLLLAANPRQGSGIDGRQYGLVGNDNNELLGKRTLGVPSTDEAPSASTPPPAHNTLPASDSAARPRVEQQITYGAIFYDRRIRLSHTWDFCSRVTFGGANDAVMGNVRAYAAFTPSKKNITFTMGVGGATLYNLSAKNSNFSVNYGVYYGVETGF